MRFNGVELTEETIKITRKLFANIALECIEEVKNGKVIVNDPESYFAWRKEEVKDAMGGKIDYTLTFLQRAYYIQTGETIALLN
ncbi:hypothetical protein [Paenibacillus sp. LK1]|uniref:hypothetical protein n=1 Tax=Paenibacillus sp. LK1 TaxID=2053014 RepID=UPI000C19B26F|nr:hypothetical protein [Paenibacillus sp. LK1]PIH59146.1 hypothetical protein CS562_14500 [Paenibacillus sp. LK1]